MKKETIKRDVIAALILAGIMLLASAIGCLARQVYDRWTQTTEPAETEWPPKMTYTYADENGWCIPGPSGVCDRRKYGEPDMDRYIPDETVIFGPFYHMPYLEFEVAGTDLNFNTEGLDICDDFIADRTDTLEERQYYYGDTIVGLASSRYEDGEIYVAVKFYKTVKDSYGKIITVLMEENDELSTEDKSMMAAERKAGRLDYFLITVPEYTHVTLQYEPEQLSVTGSYLIDTPANSPAVKGDAPILGWP